MKSIKKGVSLVLITLLLATTAVPVTGVQTVQAKTKYVYVTTSSRGQKYHKSKRCRTLRRSHVVKMKKKKARRQGYRACKVCYR